MKKWNLILILVLMICLSACSSGKRSITSKEDLNRKGTRVGTGEGSAAILIVENELPEAEIVYQDGNSGYESVAQGKLDAYIYDRRQMQLAIDSGRKGVRLLDEDMDEAVHVAAGISPVSKIPDLENRINSFISELKADGTLEDMYDRWVIKRDESMPEIGLPEDPEQYLTVGTTGVVPPYSYYVGPDLNGYDIELARRFAARLGMGLKFKVYDYGGIIPAAATGDVDCIMADLNITPERAEALTFSDDLFEEKIGIMVRDTGGAGNNTGQAFLKSLSSSLEKNFARENRWKLFVNGFMVTFVITLLSALFGTVLGFLLLFICKDGNPTANRITGFCLWIVQGMPVVVLLMILYYIVFGNMDINGVVVSVIGFTMVFGVGVFGLLKLGVKAVDRGQYEAAYALGYSVNGTFFKIILPQAIPHVVSAYKGEIVGLIKATAIVGYIAVQDLTKVGDIVRSRTYEAFFPLIAVAVIYFMLEGLFGFAVERIRGVIDPRKRKRESILNGVKTYDKD